MSEKDAELVNRTDDPPVILEKKRQSNPQDELCFGHQSHPYLYFYTQIVLIGQP